MPGDEAVNPMKELMVEKLVLNICVGTSGDPLEKARRVLKQLTGLDGSEGQEPVFSKGANEARGPAAGCRCAVGPAVELRGCGGRSLMRVHAVQRRAQSVGAAVGWAAAPLCCFLRVGSVCSQLLCCLSPQRGTPSAPSRSVVTRRSLCTSPCGETRRLRSSSAA